ncbi:MAG: PKD domain-containing protein [Solirubrobacteraceae bacterium]|nr:PKD domain-containing protein [Solirubrobacteraceae bacterium]
MPRPRTRFLLATFLSAFAVLPSAAAAAPDLRLDEVNVEGTALNDGILGPGESVNVTPVWKVGDVPFNGGNGTIAAPPGSNVATPTYLQSLPGKPSYDYVFPASPFVVQLGSQFVCGTNAPVTASVNGPDGTGTYPLTIPTGVAGPHTNYVSDDVGDIVEDTATVESQVDVTATGKVKSVRVHLDSISHEYSLKWYEITLVSPAGTRVKVWSRSGDNTQKTLTNVTFSDSATTAANTVSGQFQNMSVVPDEKLSAFNGEDAKGPKAWTLEVRDVHENNTARSNRLSRAGSGRAGNGERVGQVDGWSMDLATAECGRVPVPQIAPQPLILNPAPTAQLPKTVIDASESVDPGKNNAGNAAGKITKYEWKLAGAAGEWVSTGAVPTIEYPGGPQGKIKVSLRVTDNDNQTAVKEVDAFVTRPPVLSGASVTPASPEAGQLSTLNANASDPDGTIAQYAWDFNGDGVFEVTTSEGPTTTYSWTTSGPHVVRVKVTDNVGATAVKSFIVTVSNKPPVAKLGANASPAVLGQPVVFDASESTDPDGTIVSYDWDLDGATDFEVLGTTAPTYTKTFDETGTKTVNVRVTDNSGRSDIATMSIVVAAPPKGVIKASSNTPKPGDSVTFDGRSSTDSEVGGAITKYEWDLDGNTTYETVGSVVSRAYPNISNVQVKLRVTGSTGAKADAFTMIAVANPAVVTPPTGVGPTPVPTPKATPGPGGFVPTPVGEIPPVLGKGVDATIFPPTAVTPNEVASPKVALAPPTDDTPPSDVGTLETGFQVKLSVAAKQKGKKAIKGIAVKVTANGAGVISMKGFFDAKTAKKLKLKPKKNAPLAVASGKLVIKKPGTYKFVVKVPKKYQRYVKKANKSKLMLRAAATETASKKTLAVGKDIVLVK